MGSVPVFPKDPYGGAYGASPQFATQVDELIGSAYDVVRHVAENLEYIKHVSAHLEQIFAVAGAVDSLILLSENLDELEAIMLEMNTEKAV